MLSGGGGEGYSRESHSSEGHGSEGHGGACWPLACQVATLLS